MEQKQTLNERLLELVKDYGGPSRMAEDLGMATPQIFYNLKNRPDSKPNSETIEKVLTLLPNANMNWLYKGIGNKYIGESVAQKRMAAYSPVGSESNGAEPADYADYSEIHETNTDEMSLRVLAMQNEGLKREIALLRETNDFLRSVVSSQLGKEFGSKTESVDGPTRGDQLRLEFLNGNSRRSEPVRYYPLAGARPMARTWNNSLRRHSS